MEKLEKILKFYKKTSTYTDLGFYKDFAKDLPDDIEELCLLQRYQTIHPFDLLDEKMRNNKNSYYGDMTKINKTSLCYESDVIPTAQAMIGELLRREKNYSKERKIENKIHVCCREQAILLTSILKAKGNPARVRSGFVKYVGTNDFQAGDHWITEYYNEKQERWILVDSDLCFFEDDTLERHHIDFNLLDIPREKIIFGAEGYLGLRKKEIKEDIIYNASNPITFGLKAAIQGLFYDFHCLMNNEIIFLHMPKYIRDKNFELSEEEYQELDKLAELMLNPDENFEKLQEIWENNLKFRIMSGALN